MEEQKSMICEYSCQEEHHYPIPPPPVPPHLQDLLLSDRSDCDCMKDEEELMSTTASPQISKILLSKYFLIFISILSVVLLIIICISIIVCHIHKR